MRGSDGSGIIPETGYELGLGGCGLWAATGALFRWYPATQSVD